ncbi:Rha family transcriptional regulator [Lacrimispora defluvii]|uniref:Rha family transcriptional regulator n=1 Tax=Lacrimispora defluvii TaxID=2719233 RepID=A0ABX1VVJ7_9FIRM|nr:Rha family transcriptional regulator [Lacrimispora defluvii]NNJ32458.1 Rha family transcriptional regulator [Lacrimispora defluvii]
MYDLTVFEQNGQLLTDSREVAVAVESRHADLLEKINGFILHLTDGDFRSLDYFVPNSYIDSKGEERPCFLCTKKGCDMIANKLQGKKGVQFTARYIEAFDKMKEFIEKGVQYSKQVSFKEQVECIGVVADILRVNDASKIMMIGKLYNSYDLPTEFLQNYEYNGSRELKSATDLLKRYDLGMSAKNLNILLIEHGYLEERCRRSTTTPGKEKKYKALTEKGLKYGENAVSPQNQREVQPMYYADSFKKLFNMVVSQEVA